MTDQLSQLSQLKAMTTVVADTGDIEAIAKFQPQDATTNPSLLLKAASLANYQQLIASAVSWAKTQSSNAEQQVIDCLLYTSPSPRDLSTSRMPSSA